MAEPSKELRTLCVNTVKMLCADAIERAKSGHPGAPLGCADMAFVLWTKFLRFDPTDPSWQDRDRFVLSNGHASMLLYSLLHLFQFELPMAEIMRFRQLGSMTPGHPEAGHTPGVETTTGPLGQGFATGVGMALAQRMMQARFPGILDHNVYGIVSDGDIMEGVAAEAASLAGHLGLGNLVYLYDDNRITIEGPTSLTFSEDVSARFAACGWHTLEIDGHDHDQIEKALETARSEKERPSLVVARTTIGHGSPGKANTNGVHGEPLGADELKKTKQTLGWPFEPAFHVPPDVRTFFDGVVREKKRARQDWLTRFEKWRAQDPPRAKVWDAHWQREAPPDLDSQLLRAVGTEPAATRVLSGKAIQAAAAVVPAMVGGAADLDPSTKTGIKGGGSVSRENLAGRTLHFGIREHAMGAISNGLSRYGSFLPHTATFLIFSDYMRPAMRLACMMKERVTFVFTHDSIFLGEDGPTHQPVEQLPGLRSIPGITLFRPADGVEVAMSWAWAIGQAQAPTVLCLTRQSVPPIERPGSFQPRDVWKGGYVVSDGSDAVLVATGSEVSVAVEAKKLLAARGVSVRVVSIPSRELFERQPPEYRDSVIPPTHPLLCVIEAARGRDWCALVGKDALLCTQETFGASAPQKDLASHFGLTPEAVAEKILARLG
ncbi:MAG: transketolase [Deltaproteobacteria bacterium]|nr:transketolase [Deltaproteobacteria bacterium]